ncbi:hypothetical protein CEUSTIGMA_g13278.t1 [Chlamydomonas eustigma]|uniref:Uncharacterized protein n=1 Tax=Chlamydomonas eustigma TaxID=1157962 RepID=A0A250XSF8_9CHLO|nr:hypothetical protein CEUSTIGMA_g13278.t1 [Chlamydomonas eustigma]|eukprot:GAX85862.1 hypothetical protein CEUSTIGMA_g13278.t1 [Chlamydomonas eustigma]
MNKLAHDQVGLILSLVSVHDHPWAVCKDWHHLVLSRPDLMACMLVGISPEPIYVLVKHGPVGINRNTAVLGRLLELPRPSLDDDLSDALSVAIERGFHETVQLMLQKWPELNTPDALFQAVDLGHEDIVRLILGCPTNPQKANVKDGHALVTAAGKGLTKIVRLLLEWPENAPRADCQDGQALVEAAYYGHLDVVPLLLEWPKNAPRADCRDGDALVYATWKGHLDVVRLLLEWPENAPRADCQDGQALVYAVTYGHLDVVRFLLEWPEHTPRANCQDGQALVEAAYYGHLDMKNQILF